MKCMSHARAAAAWTCRCRRLQSLPPQASRHQQGNFVPVPAVLLSSVLDCYRFLLCVCLLTQCCVCPGTHCIFLLACRCVHDCVAGLVVASYILGRSARLLATSSCCVFCYYWLSYVYVSGHLLCFLLACCSCMIVVTGLWLFGVGLLMACDLLQKKRKERKHLFIEQIY